MAVTYGFYNSLDGDRKYNAIQMSKLFEGILNDGVFANVGTSFVVTEGTGMSVNVGEGRAWINDTWIDNDAIFEVTLSLSDVALNRIDAVVLEADPVTRINSIKNIKGSPATTPVRPTLSALQLPLCYIKVDKNVSIINQADITNMVGTEECPFVSGILETINIDGITTLLESEWNSWFAGIQEQLDGDVAGNLLVMINDIESRMLTPSSISQYLTSSYITWASNLSVAALDIAWGRYNEENVHGIGNQLRMLAYKLGANKSQYPFVNLKNADLILDLKNEALLEALRCPQLFTYILDGPTSWPVDQLFPISERIDISYSSRVAPPGETFTHALTVTQNMLDQVCIVIFEYAMTTPNVGGVIAKATFNNVLIKQLTTPNQVFNEKKLVNFMDYGISTPGEYLFQIQLSGYTQAGGTNHQYGTFAVKIMKRED